MKNIKKATDAIREELKEPLPEHQPEKEKKVATKKKGRKKSSKKVKRAGKKVNKKVKKKGAKKKTTSRSEDGTTLAELADEADISGQSARKKLRDAGIEREKGSRWIFTSAKELKAARKALGL